jgi:Arm DNA-binding domain
VPRVKLTKTAIDALPTPAKDSIYWDSGCPGFGVKITPKGRKVFIVLYEPAERDRGCANTLSGLTAASRCTRRAQQP